MYALQSKTYESSIFNVLGLQDEYEANKRLFNIDKHDKITNSECISRLSFILNVYNRWISLQQQQSSSTESLPTISQKDKFTNMTMYDILNDQLHWKYTIQSFLNDYRFVVEENRSAFGYYDPDLNEDDTKDDLFCDAQKCHIKNRNGRPRPVHGRDTNQGKGAMNKQREDIFFIRDGVNNDDNSTKSVMIQEILDTLHCWVYHSLRIDTNKYFNGDTVKKDEDDEANDDIDFDEMLYDDVVAKLGEVIKKGRESSRRFISDHRYDTINSKFITTNETDANNDNPLQMRDINESKEDDMKEDVARYQSAVYGNDQLLEANKKEERADSMVTDAITWTDDLLRILLRYGIPSITIEAMIKFFIDEDYETDSIEADVKNGDDKTSNIIVLAGGIESLRKICDIFLLEKQLDGRVYSAGWKYYYWSYYQHNTNEYEVMYREQNGKTALDGNAGYRLMDWFIHVKYASFKEEALNNESSPFGLSEYSDTYALAKEKWQNILHLKRFTARKRKGNFFEKFYGIKPGTLITVDHVLSILLYTNYTKHSYLFSSTYRKNNLYESDRSLKTRHSEYYWWGKNLRESVEIYGEPMVHRKDIPTFYHGISDSLLFNSTTIRLFGPVSTTAGLFFSSFYISRDIFGSVASDFIVAWSVFGSTGVVLDIQNRNSGAKLFNMNFFSSFTGEDEKLFLAERNRLTFCNIHNIPLKKHYQDMIKIITMTDRIMSGIVLDGMGTPMKRDAKSLMKLMNGEIEKEYRSSPYKSQYNVPKYICDTFHQFVKNKTHIQINMAPMNLHFIGHNKYFNQDWYGYQKFKSIFMNGETLKYSFILQLMYNLQEMQIYYLVNPKQGFKPSISLDDKFVTEIIESIKLVNKTIGCIFNKWIIIEPKDTIKDFIVKYESKFNQYHWKLTETEFKNKERFVSSKNVLFIHRL